MRRRYLYLWRGGLLLLAFLSLLFAWFFRQVQPVVPAAPEKTVIIRRGVSLAEISHNLAQERLIRSPLAFRLLVYLHGWQGQLQAGKFILSASMSARKIAQTLTKGRLDRWFTVPEGWRREQIAALLQKQLAFDGHRFLQLTQGKEGYLFPDSYLIPPYFDEAALVQLMEKNFRRRTATLWSQAQGKTLGQQEAVILASLVEREAKFAADRREVAAILLKRWRAGWPLQVDATIQYLKASQNCRQSLNCRWWPSLSHQDFKISSPYNTYLHSGLPPGPICNPSLAALKAVLTAPATENWYYLSDRQGHLHFARTISEHQRNIRRYLYQK